VTETAPAAMGEYLTIYLIGMGVDHANRSRGPASPSDSLADALDAPTLTLNGSPVAGLTPTAVGLYQVTFQMPAGPNGDLSLGLTQAGGVSNSTVLPVRN
jgi:uncharacterized protein (TIGR03437 family)